MVDVPTINTLHDAWLNRGQWLEVNTTTQAMLDWSEDTGWVLTFRNQQGDETRRMTFHREKELKGHSWPNGWSLQALMSLPTSWEEHRRARRRQRRLTSANRSQVRYFW